MGNHLPQHVTRILDLASKSNNVDEIVMLIRLIHNVYESEHSLTEAMAEPIVRC